MEGEIIAVGSRNFALGFHSAGVGKYLVTGDSEQAKRFINENLETAAIVLVGESLAEKMLPFIDGLMINRVLPSVVILRDDLNAKGVGYAMLEKAVEKATGTRLLAGER